MGIHYFLCLLIYLEPVIFLTAEATKVKSNKPPGSSKRPVPHPKGKDANSTSLATAAVVKAIKPQKTFKYDTCQGYYDVSGQWDSEFECNTTTHIYCCGSCSLRFCCPKKDERLDQKTCKIQSSPTTHTFTVPTTTDPYDPDKDKTNTTVYITAGVIAFILIAGVFAKVAYDKARRPPQEMTVHRALADILIQQGPIPIGHCERETIAAIDIALKEETSVISLAKNHFTPVRSSKPNHGSYGKDCNRSGGQNLHNFISSGFVTLGRGHLKGDEDWTRNRAMCTEWMHRLKEQQMERGAVGDVIAESTSFLSDAANVGDLAEEVSFHQSTASKNWQNTITDDLQHNYNHLGYGSPNQTPTNEKPRLNNILTSATEPYDLNFSRSYQNLSHLSQQAQCETTMQPDINKYSSLMRLNDKEADEYYSRKRHLPDLAARGTLPLHVIKMTQEQDNYRERRKPVRAMSQDRVLSPEKVMPEEYNMSYDRILSDEQLLSAERLQSQDPLLSPDKVMSLKRSAFREKAMSRAMSQCDVFVSTPVLDRYRMTKMHSHPSASNNYNTLSGNQTAAKRQAFASRRHNTVEQLHYIPGHHHYRTASKTEVTV